MRLIVAGTVSADVSRVAGSTTAEAAAVPVPTLQDAFAPEGDDGGAIVRHAPLSMFALASSPGGSWIVNCFGVSLADEGAKLIVIPRFWEAAA